MKILVIGRGGREHAIIKKLAEEKSHQLYAAPGNAGIANDAKLVEIDELNNEKLLEFALKEKIDLTIVGPESALMNGICDLFRKHNLMIFGPNKSSAEIEGSKEFAKKIMVESNVPTANYQSFTDYQEAVSYVKRTGVPTVIKNDGLAVGKGVVVAFTETEAIEALQLMLVEDKYNSGKVIIEEYLEGEEFSLMAFVHNEKVFPLPVAQDHKRAFDNDQGPNTGGMGAYSPVPFVTDSIISEAVEKVLKPVAKTLYKNGTPFSGILYAGLILTKAGIKVIEFNARFGDPETEVVLPKVKNKLSEVILDLLKGKDLSLEIDSSYVLGVVMASIGYPGDYQNGSVLEIKNNPAILHMGTKIKDNILKTNGGRVLFVLGQGETLEKAFQAAYLNLSDVKADKLFYRKDIGKRFIN
ncbi:MAG: phosphoribosylamine--glycine ligase [Erysipelotrichales bacterium]|nr:phosphoribosylamine--glycine ligase [Erysipelotrichales bacterium]